MEFRVLGPLVATHEGTPVALGGPKQQTVLGILLVQPGKVVSADRLIDEVWGDSPPSSARRTLQSFVANLRRALNLEAEILRGRVPGYVLDVGSDKVDSAVFTAILDEASALAPENPGDASEMLRRGLAMWQGQPFEGLTAHSPTLYAEMVRLDELRITAVEQRVDCDLAVGEHRNLIAELEYLATEYPLRERIWHQLMTALYRSGRQADALRSYQKARHTLAGELGIKPGRELQQLEQAILLQDSALAAEVDSEVSGPAAGPPQPGQTIRGYELRELVESGRAGALFRAYQPALGREVAVTAIDDSIANEPDFVRRFDESVRRIARLEHPHIVPIYDFWRDPAGAFVVSRWVPGVSLRVAIDRGPWRQDTALEVVEQVGDAISLAHRKGVAPVQLTSSDVVIDREGNTHVSMIQRGLALRVAGRSGAEVGDMDRESLREDTRALGVLLLELVTGAARPGEDAERQTWVLQQIAQVPGEARAKVKSLIRRAALDVDDAFERPDELLSAIAAAKASTVAQVVPPDETAENPYKGLRPFNEADAEDFFGRDALIEQLLEALGGTSRFVAVVGPSGSGKSSAVRAGLVPALRADAIRGSADWFVATMVPGRVPFEELEAALLRIAIDPAPGLLDILSSDATGLRRALKRTLPTDDSELLLVVDQMEELFTIADEGTSSLFIDNLVNAIADPRSRIRVVVTLRADFYDRPLNHPELGRLMHDGLVSVVPLTPTELQQAITGPAKRVGVDVEPDLVGRMIGDLSDRPGALPLLQYVLTELFDRRKGRRLTLESYSEMGGMSAALGRRAEQVFASLTEPARRAAKQLFLRLVTIEEAARETRSRVSRRSLATMTEGAAMSQAIDAFAAARLLAFDADPVSGLPTVEVAHEAIFSAWPRLGEWIDGSRAALHAQRRLGAAAADWLEHDHDTDYLASGRRLDEFDSVVADGQLAPTPLERDYVLASRDRVETTRRSRSRVRHVVTAALIVAVVVTGALAILAVVQRRDAEADARTASARGLAAESITALEIDPELSVLLALAAIEVTVETDGVVLPQAEEALHLAMQHNRLIRTIPDATVGAFGRGGDRYVAGDDSGAVRLWDLASGVVQELPEPHEDRITALTFSSGSHRIASSSDDGTVKVWDVETGGVRTFREHFGPVLDVDISADGRLLASTSVDGTARVWDLTSDSSEELLIEANATAAVSFDPTGRSLAVIDPFDPELRIVDSATGEDVASLSQRSLIVDVAFADDGSLLATATADGTVTLWDVANSTVVRTYGVKSTDIAFHERSQTLATAGADGVVRVWDIATGVEILRLAGHRGEVNSVSFDQSGTRLASAGVDGTARIWDVSPEGSREVATLSGIARPDSVGFSQDSSYLAATGDPGAMIWDTETWTVQHELPGAFAVAVSPEGSRFATIGEERVVTLHDMASGDGILDLARKPEEPTADILSAVAFTADGSSLVTGDAIGTVQIWELGSGRVLVTMPGSHFEAVEGLELDAAGDYLLSVDTGPLGSALVWDVDSARSISAPDPDADLTAAALSPDGSVVLTGGPDGATRAWNAATGDALEAPFLVEPGTVRGIAYTPDGARIATGGDDGTLRLWDASTGDFLMGWPAHVDGVTDIVFSSDGRLLASTGNDGATRVYLAQIEDLVDLAEARVTRSLTEDECRRYLHVEPC